jgi:SAM-dependent methyltransferase
MEGLRCIFCHSSINLQKKLTCNACGKDYPIKGHIPIIIDDSKSIFTEKDFLEDKQLFFESNKYHAILTKILPPLGINWKAKANYTKVAELLGQQNQKTGIKNRVLIIGGGIKGNGIEPIFNLSNTEIIESDVALEERTQIVFDSHQIPFHDNCFDLVICQAVLEHVINPSLCVQEIFRVLKNHGYVYVETPFMQQVHGGPYDFTRYTHSGHKLLLRNFKEIFSGSSMHAGTAFYWSYYYLVQAIFGWNKYTKIIAKMFARITGFPFMFLDFLIPRKQRLEGSSGFFYMGQKDSQKQYSYKNIVGYYNESRR